MAEKTTTAPLAQLTPDMAALQERFGEAIQPAEYEGVVVANDKLVEVATAIRDDLGYDYLSSVTGVDYLEQGYLEMVYHAYSTARAAGHWCSRRATPRDVAEIPSVVERLAGRGLPGARSLGPDRHPLRRSPRPAPHLDVGRL